MGPSRPSSLWLGESLDHLDPSTKFSVGSTRCAAYMKLNTRSSFAIEKPSSRTLKEYSRDRRAAQKGARVAPRRARPVPPRQDRTTILSDETTWRTASGRYGWLSTSCRHSPKVARQRAKRAAFDAHMALSDREPDSEEKARAAIEQSSMPSWLTARAMPVLLRAGTQARTRRQRTLGCPMRLEKRPPLAAGMRDSRAALASRLKSRRGDLR